MQPRRHGTNDNFFLDEQKLMCYNNMVKAMMETVALDGGMRERGAFAGSTLYNALVNTTPELQGGN